MLEAYFVVFNNLEHLFAESYFRVHHRLININNRKAYLACNTRDNIFIGFIYALSPYLILALPMFLLSNALTYNEAAIFRLVEIAIYVWCGINIILTVMELHDYSFWQAILNIILTAVCFVLMLAFAIILYALGYQLVTYFGSVIKEVTTR